MNDPFRTETNHQVLREARIGLLILAVTLGVFSYVAYKRISGSGLDLPKHVLNAPVAESVWPGAPPANATNPTAPANFGSMISGARQSFGTDWKDEKPTEIQPEKQTSRQAKSNPENQLTRVNPQPPKTNTAIEFDLNSVQHRTLAPRCEHPLKSVEEKFSSQLAKSTQQPLDVNGLRQTTTNTEPQEPPSRLSEAEPQNNGDFELASTNKPLSRNPERSTNAPTLESPPQRPVQPLTTYASAERTSNVRLPVTSDIAFSGPAQEINVPVLDRETTNEEIALSTFEAPVDEPKTGRDVEPKVDPLATADSVPSLDEESLKAESKTQYTVQNGDSFWAIAQQRYDDGRFFRALFEHNREEVGSFENLQPGTTIATPPKADLIDAFPDLCPSDTKRGARITDVDERIYITQPGDTLFEIARQRLGQASRYLQILKLNESRLDKSITHMSPLPDGTRLVLPYTQ